jgi:hypothetical protein
MYVGVDSPYLERDPRTLMITGHKINGNTAISHLKKRFHGHFKKGVWNSSAEKKISSVNHEINLTPESRGQGQVEVGEKIVSPAPALDSRLER